MNLFVLCFLLLLYQLSDPDFRITIALTAYGLFPRTIASAIFSIPALIKMAGIR